MALLDNLFSGQTNDPADEQWKRAALEELLARVSRSAAPNNDPAENPLHGAVSFAPSRSRGDIPRPMLIDQPAAGDPSPPPSPSAVPMVAPLAGTGPIDDAASPWKPPMPAMGMRDVAAPAPYGEPYAPPATTTGWAATPTPAAPTAPAVAPTATTAPGTLGGGTSDRTPSFYDRLGAFANSSSLLGGIAAAGNLDRNFEDRNATVNAIAAKIGDPGIARMIASDPDLMKVVMQNVLTPKAGDWKPIEYTDPTTGKTVAALFNAHDGRRIPLGDGKRADLPADLVTKVAQVRTSIEALKRARPVFDREFGPSELAQLAASNTPAGDISAVSGDIGRARRDMMQSAEGAIRIASGAAVPETEMGRYVQMYVPTVTDTLQSRKQKMDNLSTFLDELATAVQVKGRVLSPQEIADIQSRTASRASGAAPAASAPPASAPGTTTRLRFDPSTGTIGAR